MDGGRYTDDRMTGQKMDIVPDWGYVRIFRASLIIYLTALTGQRQFTPGGWRRGCGIFPFLCDAGSSLKSVRE